MAEASALKDMAESKLQIQSDRILSDQSWQNAFSSVRPPNTDMGKLGLGTHSDLTLAGQGIGNIEAINKAASVQETARRNLELEIYTPKVDPEKQYNEIRKAVDAKGPLFNSAPNASVLENLLPTLSFEEREKIQNRYESTHDKSMLQTLKGGFDADDNNYMELKGLLLEKDSNASKTAVALHNDLVYVNQNDACVGRSGALSNALSLSYGSVLRTAALIANSDCLSQRSERNNAIVTAASKLQPAEIAEVKAEHKRIYGTDLGQLVKNTNGLSDPAKSSLLGLKLAEQ